MGKQRDEKKRLEKAMALLALSAEGDNAEELRAECPTAEEIAFFSEGSGTELGLSLFLTHLDRCESCYRQWLLVNEEKVRQEQSSVATRIKKYSYIGSALALAASIAVFINIREPAPVFIQLDNNEVLEEKKMEQAARPSTKKTALQRMEPSPKLKVMRKTAEDREYGVHSEELEKSVTVEPADKAIKTNKGAEGLQSSPQISIQSNAATVGKVVPDAPALSVLKMAPENDSLPEFNLWIEELREGCLAGQRESSFWKLINQRGEIFYRESVVILSLSELSMLKKLLLQINKMDESSNSGHCEQILLILAEESESR